MQKMKDELSSIIKKLMFMAQKYSKSSVIPRTISVYTHVSPSIEFKNVAKLPRSHTTEEEVTHCTHT